MEIDISLYGISEKRVSRTTPHILITLAYIPPEREPACVGCSHWA